MAKAVTLKDDVTGDPDAKERRFSFGGTDYSIDLTDQSYRLFLEAVEPYRSAARVARKTRVNRAPVLSPEDRVLIRTWAKANGKKLAERGRFPNALVEEYYEQTQRQEILSLLGV